MGRILMTGGGGGADLDVITAEVDDILSGKVIVDKDGNPLTGTLTLSGDAGAGDVYQAKLSIPPIPKASRPAPWVRWAVELIRLRQLSRQYHVVVRK